MVGCGLHMSVSAPPPPLPQTDSSEIDKQVRMIDKLQTSMQYWRAKLSADTKEADER